MNEQTIRSLIACHESISSYNPLTIAEVNACIKALSLDYVQDALEYSVYPAPTVALILMLTLDILRD